MTNSGKGILLSIAVHAVILACAVLISRAIRSSIQAARVNEPIEIEVFEEMAAGESGGQGPRVRREEEHLPAPEKAGESGGQGPRIRMEETEEGVAMGKEVKLSLDDVCEQEKTAPEPEMLTPVEGSVPTPAETKPVEEVAEPKTEVGVSLEADSGEERETVSAIVVQEVKQAVPVAVIRPKYPSAARRRGIEGDVAIEATVDAGGTVTDVTVLQTSGNKALDDAAVEAMRKAKFQAAEKDGEKVPSTVRQTLSFRLR